MFTDSIPPPMLSDCEAGSRLSNETSYDGIDGKPSRVASRVLHAARAAAPKLGSGIGGVDPIQVGI